MLAILICAAEAAPVWSVSPGCSRDVPANPETSHEGRSITWMTANKSVAAKATNEANGIQRRREGTRRRSTESPFHTDAGAGDTFKDEASRAPKRISS